MIARGRLINILFFSILIITGALVRILYILPPMTLIGDTAVFGLMAKHIYEFKEFPIYMWHAHYSGALASYIGAILFTLFGISSAIFSVVAVIFSCLWVLTAFFLAKEIIGYPGCVYSLILVLLPPFHILSFSLCIGSINPETLIFGSLSLLLLIKSRKKDYRDKHIFYLLFGFFSGIGLWLTPAMAPFLLTIMTVFVIDDKKTIFRARFLVWIIGFLLGYLPAIIYNFQYPWATLFRLAGRILDIDRSVLSSPDLKAIIMERILWRIKTIPVFLAHIPSMLFSLLGIINAAIFFIAIYRIFKKKFLCFSTNKETAQINILIIYIFWFVIFCLLLVGKEAIRYMVPLYVVLPIVVGRLLSDIKIKSRVISLVLLCAMLCYNAYGNTYGYLNREVHHYPELAKRLMSKNLLYGYSDYWTAYPVIFESNEKVLLSPTLFHPTFSDRRPEYTVKVRDAKNIAFILDRNTHYQAIIEIEKQLKNLHINYVKDTFKEFVIYYNFSQPIYPEKLNLDIQWE